MDVYKEHYRILDILKDAVGYHDVRILAGNRKIYYDWKGSLQILDCRDKPAWVVLERTRQNGAYKKKIGEYESLLLALKALINEES